MQTPPPPPLKGVIICKGRDFAAPWYVYAVVMAERRDWEGEEEGSEGGREEKGGEAGWVKARLYSPGRNGNKNTEYAF